MHKPSLTEAIYKHLYPRPNAQKDPPSFALFVNRLLVPEVRTETTNFYGSLNCVEAQYPGLDYSFWAHRQRLWRFPHHRRLFRAFDELGLTRDEIYTVCHWEGTKSAKDKYEKDAGRKIKDTTLDGVALEEERPEPVVYYHGEEDEESDMSDDDEMETPPPEVRESYGVQLNEQLRAAADAQARGEPVVFDEQWEQWMKEALERNELGMNALIDSIREGQQFPISPNGILETPNDTVSDGSLTSPSSPVVAPVPEPLLATTASTSTQTTPRLSHTQEAIASSLRRLDSRMNEMGTPVPAATAEQLAAQAR